jgi:hypothetical protein
MKIQDQHTTPEVGELFSQSVEMLIAKLRPEGAVPVMTVVDELLRTHPWYLASRQLPTARPPEDIMKVSSRTIDEHISLVRNIWDSALIPKISGRRVLLGLALADQLLAYWAVTSGLAAAVVESWSRDRAARQGGEGPPYASLSAFGRSLADALPLFRASLGGGPTWSTELASDITQLAWSHDKSMILTVDAEGNSQLVSSSASRWAPRFPGPMIDIALPGNDAYQAVGAYLDADGELAIYNAPGATSLVVRPHAIESVSSVALSGDGRSVWVGGTKIQRGATTARQLAVAGEVGEGEILGASATGERSAVWSHARSELSVLNCPEPEVDVATVAPATEQAYRVDRPAAAAVSDSGTLGWGSDARVEIAIAGVQVASLAIPGHVNRLSLTSNGEHLAVAAGRFVYAWDLSTDRRAHQLGWYDSDSLDRRDLLGRDRDVGALAALVASEVLVPPLTVGIFGAWGSGKSWFVRRLQEAVEELTGSDADGYLHNVRFVDFDAWQYAETDLVASLVARVHAKLLPPADGMPATLKAANEGLVAADAVLERAAEEEKQSAEAYRRRRSWFWWLLGGLLIVVAGLVSVFGGTAVVSLVTGLLAVLATAVGILHRFRDAQAQVQELVRAGRTTSTAFSRWSGQDQLRTAAEAAEKKNQAQTMRDSAQTQLDQLKADPISAVLEDVSGWQEYSELLGLVSRTEERFAELDGAVTKLRREFRAGEPVPPPNLERVVVVIDDLDRCPAEKVVHVLEAVHLLFDFELFVVLLAVDTRWLEQSLRIRYKELLAGEANADPSDFLEKIIQVPFHIKPLEPSDAAALVAGLAGPRSASRQQAAKPTALQTASNEGREQVVQPSPRSPRATDAHGESSVETSRVAAPPPPAQRQLDAGAGQGTQTLSLPADLLQLTDAELGWLTSVSPLIGTTPRTVKRFLNTYRLLKARSRHPEEFAENARGIAFLLALVTGQSALADDVLAAIQLPSSPSTLDRLLAGIRAKSTQEGRQLWHVQRFIESTNFGNLKKADLIRYADEVARFSFNRPSS